MRLNKQTRSALLLLSVSCAGMSTAYALEPDELFRRVQDSVMVVKVYDAKDAIMARGSAVLVAPENLLTNCHVLAKAKRIEVAQDNVTYGAELVHIDLERDLCQIRARNFRAKPVDLGNSDSVRVGTRVYALGNPRGLELTLSDGLVSALRKEPDGSLRYIQTTAPISPGSSGGALFDNNGKLIGITTMYRVDSQNLNFAIPINMFRELPDRSKAALTKATEKAAAEKAAVELASSAGKAAGKQEETLMLDQELRDHFSQARKVPAQVAGSQGNLDVSFESLPNGKIRIHNMSKNMAQLPSVGVALAQFAASDGTARWRLKGVDQVCLSFDSMGFSSLHGCYRLFLSGPKKYTLRSVTDNSYIQYSDE